MINVLVTVLLAHFTIIIETVPQLHTKLPNLILTNTSLTKAGSETLDWAIIWLVTVRPLAEELGVSIQFFNTKHDLSSSG